MNLRSGTAPVRAHVLAMLCAAAGLAACGPTERQDASSADSVLTGSDAAPRAAGPLGIVFDPATARAGDVIGDMTLEDISAEPTVVDSTLVGSARFLGRIELSGRVLPHFDADMRTSSVCFEADSVSAARLPRWRHDERRPWFCFSNPEAASRLSDGESATIVIDRFTIHRNLTDAVNSARLASVVRTGSMTDDRQRVSCDGLESSLLAAEPTRAGLRAAAGGPVSIDVTTEPNRHTPDATDSLFTVRYRDLEVRIRRPPSGADMAEHVSIRGSRWVRHSGLGIGAPAAQVVAILGEPTTRRPDELVYDCGEHTEQPVTFHLAEGTVDRISIAYYVD